MKFLKYFLVAALLTLVGFVPQSKAQLSLCFHPSYSTYVTQVFPNVTYQTSGVYSIQQVAHIIGNAGVNGSCTNMTSGIHTPSVSNVLGSYGGTQTGPGVCSFCQTDWTSITSGLFNVSTIYSSNVLFSMRCSIAGAFWSFVSNLQWEIAYTFAFNTGAIRNSYVDAAGRTHFVYAITSYCTTIDPDYKPATLDTLGIYPYATVKYAHTIDVCTRYVGTHTWICATYIPGVTSPALTTTGTLPVQNPSPYCTYNP